MIFTVPKQRSANHQRRPEAGSFALFLSYSWESTIVYRSNFAVSYDRSLMIGSRRTRHKFRNQRTKIAGGSPLR
jgi:hypothetical protein